jgi:sterol desaturase/sphingolipid hydroxylase (fatty acid hydroxylase superfamily)
MIMKYWNTFINSFGDYASYLYHEIRYPSWHNYFYWLIGISLFFFLLEWFYPWRKDQPKIREDFWMDGFYMFFNFFLFSLIGYNAISNVFVAAFNDSLGAIGIKNLVAIEIGSWPIWAQLLTLFVVRDFIHWNVHRLLHRVPFLWEFHKVHHSVKQMGFAAHLRYHWMENIVYRTIEYIPLGMIGFGIQEFFLVHIVALSIGHFNHSNINIRLGPLKYLFNNPQMHTWHHARHWPERYRYGVNFGISLSIWDFLFGTAFLTSGSEKVELGIDDEKNFPKSFWRQSLYGFNSKRNRNL